MIMYVETDQQDNEVWETRQSYKTKYTKTQEKKN